MHRIVRIEALEDYRIRLWFVDGTEGVADLADLAGRGVFAIWANYETFRHAEIGPYGELRWGDEADLCPDSLYMRVTGKTPEEVFPALRGLHAHA